MRQYGYSFARPDGSVANYRISATGKHDAAVSANRVRKQLAKHWAEPNKIMTLGDPLPSWFMNAMSRGLIITQKCNYNGPLDSDMSGFRAFVWNGKEIKTAEVGDQIVDNGNGTYDVWK